MTIFPQALALDSSDVYEKSIDIFLNILNFLEKFAKQFVAFIIKVLARHFNNIQTTVTFSSTKAIETTQATGNYFIYNGDLYP